MKRPPVIVVKLVHLAGPRKLEIQEFIKDEIRIGKYSECHVRFPPDDPEVGPVSRAHAKIVREGNRFKLIDSSANGTFVNGEEVTETYLKNGDVLEFSPGGPKVSFLTDVREAPAEPGPTPPCLTKNETAQPPGDPLPVAPKPPPETPPGAVEAPLTLQYGPTIRSYKVLPVTIGKGLGCHCVLDHPAVYDQHAQIFFTQNQYWIKDLTGQKLVQINRAPIAFQAPLTEDDEVALSPQGPFLWYVGEGRIAEAVGVTAEEPPRAKQEAATGPSKDQPSHGVVPRLKKLFRT